MATLILPLGAPDGFVSYGDEQFPIYRPDPQGPWLVDIPDPIAPYFTRNMGFQMARSRQQVEMPPGMARLVHPEGPRTCSYDGQTYEPDGDGIITVPAAAVEHLICFGFVPAPDDTKE